MLKPNAAAVLLHHALADRQSDATARIFVAAVQAFEETEDLLRELRFNPNSVIMYGEFIPLRPDRAPIQCDPFGAGVVEFELVPLFLLTEQVVLIH